MALLASIQAGSIVKTVAGAVLVAAGLTVSGQVAEEYALRERAYALAGSGQCRAAHSAFAELVRSMPSDWPVMDKLMILAKCQEVQIGLLIWPFALTEILPQVTACKDIVLEQRIPIRVRVHCP